MKNQNGKVVAIVITIVAIVILALAGAGAYVYFTTDLLKTPKELFSKYSEKTAEILNAKEVEKVGTSLEDIMKGKFETKTSVTLEGKNIATMMFSNFKIDMKGAVDPENDKLVENIDLQYKKNSLMDISVLAAKDKFGIKDSKVLQKYLTLENRDLDKLLAKFGVETAGVIPSKIDLDAIEENLPEINIDVDKYINIVKEGIKDGRYSAVKNEEIDFNGNKVKANGYALSLNKEEVSTILKSIVKEFKNEDELIDCIVKYSQGETTKQDVKLALDVVIAELDENNSKEEIIKVTVYENKGKTIKLKSEFFGENDEDIIVTLDIVNDNEFLLSIVAEDVQIDVKITKKIENGISEYTIDVKQDKVDTFKVTIQIDNSEKDSVKTKVVFEVVGLAAIKVSNEITKNNNVQIPDFSSTNSDVINDYTQEQLVTLINELAPKFQTSYSKEIETVMKDFEMFLQ